MSGERVALSQTQFLTNFLFFFHCSELTGRWSVDKKGKDVFIASNYGIALVESEVADVYALRLKVRDGPAPLVSYSMRPCL